MTENDQGTTNAEEGAPLRLASATVLVGGLSGCFVEFDHLPYLLDNLRSARRRGFDPNWQQVLHSIRAGREELGLGWLDDYSDCPPDSAPSLEEAVEGAWQLSERVEFIKSGRLTESGREIASFAQLDRKAHRGLLVPILAKGVESALVGQEGVPLIPLLRHAAHSLLDTKSVWAGQIPGLLPIEVAAVVHWAGIDIQHSRTLIREIEIIRDLAMHGEDPPLANEDIDLETLYEITTDFYWERGDLLGQVQSGDVLASARLLAYCGLIEGVPLNPPDMTDFYLVAR